MGSLGVIHVTGDQRMTLLMMLKDRDNYILFIIITIIIIINITIITSTFGRRSWLITVRTDQSIKWIVWQEDSLDLTAD